MSSDARDVGNAGMKVAITGASGFIGRRLTAIHAARGDEIRVLSRRPSPPPGITLSSAIQYFRGNLADASSIPVAFFNNADILYHCAAELRNEAQMVQVNVDGTHRLTQAAAGKIGRWVQLSSVGVYGPHRDGVITEASAVAPHNIYEHSKAEADYIVAEAGSSGAFATVILRPSIVFGPNMPNRSLFQLARMIQRGWFRLVGPPGASANYIYVDNVIDALDICAHHPAAAGGVFNLSDYRTLEVFVATIASCLGVPAPTGRVPEGLLRGVASLLQWIPGSPLTTSRVDALTVHSRYPSDLLEQRLGYHHRLTMEEALNRTLAPLQTISRKD